MATSLFAHASVHHSIRRLIAVLALTLTGLAGSARAQSLGVQGDHFIVDGEAKFLTFVSYFDGMRATDYDGDFAFLKDQAGFDGVRIFPNWWTYSGSPTNCPAAATDTLFDASGNVRGDNGDVLAPSGRLLRLIQVLRAAQKYRLIVDLSFTRETVSGSLSIANYQRALQRTAFLLREYRNVIFDIQNERDNVNSNQFLSHDDARIIKDAIKNATSGDPSRLVMASSGGGTPPVGSGGLYDFTGATGFNLRAELNALAYHDARGAGWQDRTTSVVSSLRQINQGVATPVYLQEPTRWRMATNACGVTENDGSSDPDPAHFRTALQLAKAAGAAAWTFHTQRAFRLPATGSLRQQILALPAGNAERDLYLGAGTTKLSATPGTWLVSLDLTLHVTGPGRVISDVGGISCTAANEATCHTTVAPGTAVTFTTQVDTNTAGARFDGWDLLWSDTAAPCAGTPACQVTVRAPTDIGARFGITPPEKTEYLHTDALGSIRAVTDVNGLLVAARNDYLPFGEVFSGVSGDPTVTRRLFSGKERDAESGFDYFGARYYASGIGRFTATDPVTLISSAQADPQLWNKYAYVRNSPLGHTDPDGRCPDACVVEAGVAYGVYETVVVTAAGAAWLVSPSGRAAVAQVGRDIGTMATTAAGKIQSWFQTEKRPGTLGKPDHQATAEEERQRINGEREVRIDTPGGKKDFRKADAAGTNPETGAKEIVQVYRPTPAGNIPKREKDAAADIHQHDGTKPTMVPVRPIPKKPQPETP